MMNTNNGGGGRGGKEVQLIQTIITMLTNHENPHNLQPFIPHLILPIIISILSWKPLHSHPTTLISFFKWFRIKAHFDYPHHSLHSHLLHSDHSIPKPILDTSLAAYVISQQPQLTFQIFNKMKRLHFRPNLLTCNTLLYDLVRSNSSHSLVLSRQVFKDVVKRGV